MEQKFQVWSKGRRLTLDLASMMVTLGMCLSSFSSASKEAPADRLFSIVLMLVVTLSSAAIGLIVFAPDVFVVCRDYIMSVMWVPYHCTWLPALNWF